MGDLQNHFAALQVAGFYLREKKLLNCEVLTVQDGTATQLLSFTKVMTSAFPPSRSLLSGHAQVTEKPLIAQEGAVALATFACESHD